MKTINGFFFTENKKPKYLVIKHKILGSKYTLKKCPHCNNGTLEQFYYQFTLTRTKINNFGVYTFLGCDKCNTYKIHTGKYKELSVYDVCNKSTSVNAKEYKELLNLYENSINVVKFLDDFPQRRFSKDLSLKSLKKMINNEQYYSMVVNEIKFYRPNMKECCNNNCNQGRNCKLKHEFNCFSILTSSLFFALAVLFFLFVLVCAENITGYISNILESIVFSSF